MTLVLTWLFPIGIVMGADSAITYPDAFVTGANGRRRPRILTDCTKVFPIPKINAGISFWGKSVGNSTDVWLSEFITSREEEYNNISEFAVLLQNELRRLVPRITAPENSREHRYGNRGFHLAGYVDYNGENIPTFYHIHNGRSEVYPTIDPRIVNANQDFPPEKISRLFLQHRAPHVRNGAFFLYSRLFNDLLPLINDLNDRLNIRFPDPNKFTTPLEAYSEFVRFWIRLTRDIFALSNLPEIIGGDISVLSISPTGETNFTKKP